MSYQLLVAAGHSPAKAQEILLDASRGIKHAQNWVQAVENTMKQVAAYETSDGKLFSLKADALSHEAGMDLLEWVEQTALIQDDEDRESMVGSMINSRERLVEILRSLGDEESK